LNKYWIYAQHDDRDGNPNKIGAFIFAFESDTLINGISYTKLIKYGLPGEHQCSRPPCFRAYTPYQINTNHKTAFAYLREDTLSKKVFCLPAFNFHKFCDTIEHVLYDFNQKVGDTLSTCNLLIHSAHRINDKYFTIDSIKMEVINDKLRKVFYFNGFRYLGMPHITLMKMIEGIGLVVNLGFYYDQTARFHSFCEGTLANCNIINTTLEKINPKQLIFSPNPVLDLLHIGTEIGIQKSEIIDLNGRIVLSSPEKDINVSQLLSGVYFVKCFGANNKLYFSKFVKM